MFPNQRASINSNASVLLDLVPNNTMTNQDTIEAFESTSIKYKII